MQLEGPSGGCVCDRGVTGVCMCHQGVCDWGVTGVCAGGGVHPPDQRHSYQPEVHPEPQAATEACVTHPTEMHSC